MKEFFDFLYNDWKKIPQNLRYFIWLGVFLIFNSWLLDHWGLPNPYSFWVWDIRQFGYSLGISLIVLALDYLF